MADPGGIEGLPQATVVRAKRMRVSVIWIIPLLAAVVAIGIAVQRIRSEGPTITIVFNAAEGIEAGKTLVRYKDVPIGRVTAVHLTSDYTKVEVTAKITKRSAGLMVEDAKFWIVRPVISLSGISGLNTLLSGNYIGFQPGKSESSQDEFVGLDVAPVVTDQKGREFVLNAPDVGSLDVGSPIYYRRLPVGQIVSYDLAPDGNSVRMKVFVNEPYDKFVFKGTRFWNASGVEVTAGADGVNVRTESLVALLVGGLAFDTPPFEPREPAAADAVFTLYGDRTVAMKAPDPVARHFVLYFRESLRGLSVGAPVTFLGLPAGEVTAVGIDIDQGKQTIRSRVQVTFYPERLVGYTGKKGEQAAALTAAMHDEEKHRAFVRRLVEERGLRAQLRTGSLLTGQLYVAFDYYPRAARAKVDLSQADPELPVVPSALADLEDKLASIVDKVDKMPLEEIGTNVKKDLENLDLALTDARKLLSSADTKLVPGITAALDDLRRTLAATERAMSSANESLLESNAVAQEELRNALAEFTRAARGLRVLTDELERQPSSLIRGKSETTGWK
jgi:paraquat-inducible protein B